MPKRNRNNRQDVDIATLDTKVKNLKERFDKFVDNEFKHLRARVDWILWILIVGSLLAILIKFAF